MPDYFIPLQKTQDREGPSLAVVPFVLSDDEDALKNLPDGEYVLVAVSTDDDGNVTDASVGAAKKVKTPAASAKVTDL